MKTPHYRKIDKSQSYSDSHIKAASELINEGKIDEAIDNLGNALQNVDHKYPILKKLAELYRNQHKYKNARENIDLALQINPYDIESHEMLFEISLEQGDYDEVIKYSCNLLKLSPKSLSARDALYFAYLQKGLLDQALQITNELIRIDPYSPMHHYKKAYIHHEKGDISAAIHELSRVLEMSPDDEMEEEALQAIDQLDSFQIRHILMLGIEDFIFRAKLIRDPESAVAERGYYLSNSGLNILRQIDFDDLPEIYLEWKHRYYH